MSTPSSTSLTAISGHPAPIVAVPFDMLLWPVVGFTLLVVLGWVVLKLVLWVGSRPPRRQEPRRIGDRPRRVTAARTGVSGDE